MQGFGLISEAQLTKDVGNDNGFLRRQVCLDSHCSILLFIMDFNLLYHVPLRIWRTAFVKQCPALTGAG